MHLSNWCSSGLLKSYTAFMAFPERETKRNKKHTINDTKHQVSCWSKSTIGWPSSPRQLSLDRGLLDRSTGKRLVSLVIPKKGWQWTGIWLYLDVPAVIRWSSQWHTWINGDRQLDARVSNPTSAFRETSRILVGWYTMLEMSRSRLHYFQIAFDPFRKWSDYVYNVLTAPDQNFGLEDVWPDSQGFKFAQRWW